MYDAPPPYPGIDPNLSAYTAAPPQVNGHHPAPPPPATASAPYPDGPQSAAAPATASAPYPDGPQSAAAGLLFDDYYLLDGAALVFSVLRVVLCEYSKFQIKSNSYLLFDSKLTQLFEIFE